MLPSPSRLEPQSGLMEVAGNGHRQTGQQSGHPTDVTVVFSGAIGVAPQHVTDGARSQGRNFAQHR
jgi:hypothetical protein